MMNTPSPQLIGFTFGLMARLHAMVGDEQALIILGGIDLALGHGSQDDHEISMQTSFDENTKALVLMLVVSTPDAKLTSSAAIIAHLNAVAALVAATKNNALRN